MLVKSPLFYTKVIDISVYSGNQPPTSKIKRITIYFIKLTILGRHPKIEI
jgi:hypothetical protein